MRAPGQPDCFQVINGPEDGAEFPLVRAPFYVGQDPRCAVHISLDTSVLDQHALATVCSQGYRIRRIGRSPVYVDGKQAGVFRSRVVQNGGHLQVGQTLLALECAQDGLATKGKGCVTQSDFGYAVGRFARVIRRAIGDVWSFAMWLLGRIVTSWWLALGAVVVLYFTWPPFNRFAGNLLRWVQMTLTRLGQ